MKKLGVVFGGMSTENEVSVISAKSVMNHLNQEKYELYPIYIDKSGTWYHASALGEKEDKIEDVMCFLKSLDVVFPVLHGLYGEDGTIQGLFELLKIPYVGCGVLASSVGMDKVYSKIVFERAGLHQAEYCYIRKREDSYFLVADNMEEILLTEQKMITVVEDKMSYPIFVKPSNSGSSVGIRKVTNEKELLEAVVYAAQFDTKILLEQGIVGRELECAVLGGKEVKASCIGEVLAADEFYSYEAKYHNQQSKTVIPANIPQEKIEEIQKSAIHAFQSIDGKGLSRVDFFLEEETNKVIINEINTMPGFTSISMYPKLWEASGISYGELLDCLINTV